MNALRACRELSRAARPAALLMLLIPCGCSDESAPPAEPVRPVKTMVVTAGGETRTRFFPGKAEAAQRAELAFQVPGLLVDIPVREGQTVASGDVIAQLRPDEFEARLATLQGQLDQARAALRALLAGDRPEQRMRLEAQVRAAAAQLANARSEYERNARLVRSNVVSREEFERSETIYHVAQEEHKAALQLLEKGTIAREEDIDAQEAVVRGLEGRVVEAALQLDDATLRAPYDGVIAQRFVEANQNVQAGQAIVKFQDVQEIDVLVDVPEAIMAADLQRADIVEILAEFSGAPGLQFPAYVKEIAQRADPVTQTFQIRIGLKMPPEINLLPGMTATATLTYRRADVLGNQVLVPVSAVFRDASGAQAVWIVDADSKVARRDVTLGEPQGGQVEVVAGLEPGDRIAIAGAGLLREGMKVRDLGDALGGRP